MPSFLLIFRSIGPSALLRKLDQTAWAEFLIEFSPQLVSGFAWSSPCSDATRGQKGQSEWQKLRWFHTFCCNHFHVKWTTSHLLVKWTPHTLYEKWASYPCVWGRPLTRFVWSKRLDDLKGLNYVIFILTSHWPPSRYDLCKLKYQRKNYFSAL